MRAEAGSWPSFGCLCAMELRRGDAALNDMRWLAGSKFDGAHAMPEDIADTAACCCQKARAETTTFSGEGGDDDCSGWEDAMRTRAGAGVATKRFCCISGDISASCSQARWTCKGVGEQCCAVCAVRWTLRHDESSVCCCGVNGDVMPPRAQLTCRLGNESGDPPCRYMSTSTSLCEHDGFGDGERDRCG